MKVNICSYELKRKAIHNFTLTFLNAHFMLQPDFRRTGHISPSLAGIRRRWLNVAGFQYKWPDSCQTVRNLVRRNPTTIAGCHRILAQIARFRHRWNFSDHRRNPTYVAGFLQLDTKIRGPSTVDSGYQQTPMPSVCGFPQTCVKE